MHADYTQLRNMQQYHVYTRSADLVHTKKAKGKKCSSMTSDESAEL